MINCYFTQTIAIYCCKRILKIKKQLESPKKPSLSHQFVALLFLPQPKGIQCHLQRLERKHFSAPNFSFRILLVPIEHEIYSTEFILQPFDSRSFVVRALCEMKPCASVEGLVVGMTSKQPSTDYLHPRTNNLLSIYRRRRSYLPG